MHIDKDKHAFIDEMAATVERVFGLPRMGGRLWAVLLITDRERLSAEELMEAVHASRGSVSTMIRTLESIGLVNRVSMRGDRRHYYKASEPDALMRAELASMKLFMELMASGKRALSPEDMRAAKRLDEMYDLMQFFEKEYDALLERWHRRNEGT